MLTLSKTLFSITGLDIMAHSITTLSIMPLSIIIKHAALRIVTLMTAKKCDPQHNVIDAGCDN
jgi:hypothetical protein